ncbi:MAG: flavin-binding protein dodecin [Saprospiraceae bacterium]
MNHADPSAIIIVNINFTIGTITSVARVTEIIASSNKDFDDAIKKGVKRAAKTLKNVRSAWVKDQTVSIEDGKFRHTVFQCTSLLF